MFKPFGCHDTRTALTIRERSCPCCGGAVELFVRDGMLAAEARCEVCGFCWQAGTPAEETKCD